MGQHQKSAWAVLVLGKGRVVKYYDLARYLYKSIPWEPTTFIFRGYNPYIGGSKPSFFHGFLGSKGIYIYI